MNTSVSNHWLETVSQRLASRGFKVSKDVAYQGQPIQRVGHRSGFQLTKFGNSETFFVFSGFGQLNRDAMRQYCDRAFDFAIASKKVPLPCGLFESVYCFAVAIVDALDEATANAVRTETPTMRFAAAQIPVVYESRHNRLCFFEKTPLWGSAYYAGFRKQIRHALEVN